MSQDRNESTASLASRANLGPKSAAFLESAGIRTFEQLASLGSVAAFAEVRKREPRASLNLLWALEGALTGQHWRVVAREHRTSLLLALESHERGGEDPDPSTGADVHVATPPARRRP